MQWQGVDRSTISDLVAMGALFQGMSIMSAEVVPFSLHLGLQVVVAAVLVGGQGHL